MSDEDINIGDLYVLRNPQAKVKSLFVGATPRFEQICYEGFKQPLLLVETYPVESDMWLRTSKKLFGEYSKYYCFLYDGLKIDTIRFTKEAFISSFRNISNE
jgi:hypothetical protein